MEASTELKAELSLLMPALTCCQRSELQALALALAGGLEGRWLALKTRVNPVARKLVRLARRVGVDQTEFRKSPTVQRPAYTVRLATAWAPAAAQQAAAVPERPCCRRAFLRGAFLASGSLMAPARGYHLELALRSGAAAEVVAAILKRCELQPGHYQRRRRWVVYLKDAPGIAKCLSLMGASRTVLAFEAFRVVQEMRAQVNRRTNTETANLNKSIRTAMDQAVRVHQLEVDGRLDRLPPALRSAATLRLAHPRAPLAELARRAQVSKSAMNGRLRRLLAAGPR